MTANALDRPLKITRFNSQFANKKREVTTTLRDLETKIKSIVKPDKDSCPWLKLACFGDDQSDKKSLRHDANVLTIDGIEGDYDEGEITMADATARLEKAGVAALLYESASNTLQEPRYRILCPTSKTLAPNKRANLVARLNGLLDGSLDGVSFTLSQAFLFGNIEGKAPIRTALVEGEYIDKAENLEATKLGRRSKRETAESDGEYVADDTGSGAAFRKAVNLQLAFEDVEEFESWAAENPWNDYQKDPERAVQRTWERAGKQAWEFTKQKGLTVTADDFEDLGAGDLEKPTAKSGLTFYNPEQINDIPEAYAFFQNIYYENQISEVYGAPGSGKTFGVFDQCAHAALGRPWQGLDVDQTNVLYIALEGSSGLKRRREAWCKEKGFADPEKLPIHFGDGFLDLRKSRVTRRAIIDYIKLHKIGWLCIDTLSRALAGGDENSAKDMGELYMGADEIRRATGAHVTIIHHSGKDASKGARGSSVMLGNIETEIAFARDGQNRSITLTKQKEGEDGQRWDFQLKTVLLGRRQRRNKTGTFEPITSCVVVYNAADFEAVEDDLSARDRAALNILNQLARETETRDDDGNPIVSRVTFRKALKSSHWPKKDCKPNVRANAMKRALEEFKREYNVLITNDNIKCSHDVNCSREPA